jgi:hypothetical protein
VAIVRGLAVNFDPDDPGLCAVIELAVDALELAGRRGGPDGDLLEGLGKARVVLVCRKPGSHPRVGRARLCDDHHQQLDRARDPRPEGGGRQAEP